MDKLSSKFNASELSNEMLNCKPDLVNIKIIGAYEKLKCKQNLKKQLKLCTPQKISANDSKH